MNIKILVKLVTCMCVIAIVSGILVPDHLSQSNMFQIACMVGIAMGVGTFAGWEISEYKHRKEMAVIVAERLIRKPLDNNSTSPSDMQNAAASSSMMAIASSSHNSNINIGLAGMAQQQASILGSLLGQGNVSSLGKR